MVICLLFFVLQAYHKPTGYTCKLYADIFVWSFADTSIYIYGKNVSSFADIFVCCLAGWLTNDTIWMRDGHPEPPVVMWKKNQRFPSKKNTSRLYFDNFIHVCCQVSLGSPIFFGIGIPRKSWAVYWHDTHEVNDSGCVDKMQFRKVVRMLQDDGRDGGCSQISDLPSGKHTKSYWKWCFIVKWIF